MRYLSKPILLLLGHLFCLLGIIGIAVPGLPTTPFLLLASFFYSRGSARFHSWLINHERLGPPVVAWQDHGVIATKAKVLAVILIIGNLSIPVYFWPIAPVPRILAALTGVILIWFITSRPSQPRSESHTGD